MRRNRKKSAEGAPARMLRCESLEPRRLLAGDVGVASVDSGVLTVWGDRNRDNVDDVIVVQPVVGDSSAIKVVVNGAVVATHALEGLRRIVIAGGRGDDTIRIDVPSLPFGCTIRGGPGNDTISGGPRGDRLHGGEGDDTIDGNDGNDDIVGGVGDDYLRGGRGADRILGLAGVDSVGGGLGNDVLIGGEGDDTLDGEAGIDVLHGEDGDDALLGGLGRDRLFAGSGADRLFGVAGRDRLVHDDIDRIIESEAANPLVVAETEAAVERWLHGQATRWSHEEVFGTMAFGVARAEVSPPRDTGIAPHPSAVTLAGSPAGGDFSSTNNQVAGVDEADLVRTDGRFIYMLNDGELLVIDADPASLAIVSRTPIEGFGSVLYLHGDRVTVLSQTQLFDEGRVPEQFFVDDVGWVTTCGGLPLLVAYRVNATVIDVADRANPVVLERLQVDGRLAASRSIGAAVTLLVENQPRVTAAEPMSELPIAFSTTAAGETRQPLVEPGNLYLPIHGGGNDLLSIVSFDPTDATPGIDRSVSTLGMAGTVYASFDSVIIAAADYGAWWGASEGATTLHAFSLEGEMPHLAGGSVPGFVLDQFAIDAHADGTVRIVTQTGWGREASTNLFVLEPQAGEYEEIGSVRGIAPGERAMSARFLGDTAYVVTFEQVDPLFVIDLADPTAPTIVGELMIPGFSSYLHPVDGTHLIGVGRSADLSGVKVSLFDVAVPATPTEAGFLEFVATGGYAWSMAEHDHHAFSFFAEYGVAAIPVSRAIWPAPSPEGFVWGVPTYSNGLVVVSVNPVEGSLRELATIEHQGTVLRSLRIGSRLYSISETSLAVVELADPATVVADLSLTRPA